MSLVRPQKQSFSSGESGTQVAIQIANNLTPTFFLSAGAADDVTIEANLSVDGGFTWTPLDSTLTNFINSSGIFTTVGPVDALRVVLNNVAVAVVFEVLQARYSI